MEDVEMVGAGLAINRSAAAAALDQPNYAVNTADDPNRMLASTPYSKQVELFQKQSSFNQAEPNAPRSDSMSAVYQKFNSQAAQEIIQNRTDQATNQQ